MNEQPTENAKLPDDRPRFESFADRYGQQAIAVVIVFVLILVMIPALVALLASGRRSPSEPSPTSTPTSLHSLQPAARQLLTGSDDNWTRNAAVSPISGRAYYTTIRQASALSAVK